MKPVLICVACTCVSVLFAASAQCLTTDTDWLQVSGFVSQGAIYTSNNNWFGKTDDTVGFDFREVGAAIAITPAPNLRFSTQLLSRRAGANDDGSLRLDHAMISYDFLDNADWTVGIRAGRYKAPMGWYNDTRDVPFTRTSIFLPQGVYLERVRNSFFFQNGAELRGEWRQKLNTLSWHAGFYRPKVDTDELADIARVPSDSNFIEDARGEDSWSSGLVYDIDGGKARLGVYYEAQKIRLFGDPAAAAPQLPDADGNTLVNSHKTVLSFEYNLDKLTFAAERAITRIRPETSIANPQYAFIESVADAPLDTLGYYYQAIYRFSEQWDFFVRYDGFFIDEDDKNGDQLVNSPTFNLRGLPAYAFYCKSYTLGAGWHPATDWLVRIEWLNAEGTGSLNVNDNADKTPVKYWDMVAMQLSWRF